MKLAAFGLLSVAFAPVVALAQDASSEDVAGQLAQLKAIQSRDLLKKGDRRQAIARALEGLPKNFTEADIAKRPEAYEALYWAVRSRNLRLPLQGAVHPAFNYQGTRVATVSAEVGASARKEALKLWDAKTGALVAELLPLERSGTVGGTLMPASFSRDGRYVMHIDPGSARPVVWDAETGKVLHELPKVPGASGMMVTVPRPELSATGKYALVANASGVRLYDVASEKTLWTSKEPMVMAAGISPDETQVVTAAVTGSRGGGEYQKVRITIYDAASGKKTWSTDVAEPSWGAYGAIFSGDGRLVGVTTSSDKLLIVEPGTGNVQRIPVARVGTSGFSFSPDAKYVAVVAEDWSTTEPVIYEVASGQKATLPLDQRASIDSVYTETGEEVGVPWFPDAGDIWRKGVTGPALYDAAMAVLAGREPEPSGVVGAKSTPPTESPSAESTAERAWLGVRIANSSDPQGVTIQEVVANGPAADKLKVGDLVLEVDKVKVANAEELAQAVHSRAPGEPIMLKLLRDGKARYEAVELGRFPAE